MRVCLLLPVLDAFKGANHLPLLAACKDCEFTILTGQTKPTSPELPPNVRIEKLNIRMGPYYYGSRDFRFARAVTDTYPPSHEFWKQFDVIHLNQTMGPSLKKLSKTRVPVLFFIHHPVTADLQAAVEESSWLEGLRWRARYALLKFWQGRLAKVFPVATVSSTAAKRIADDYGRNVSAIEIVPNGVDTDVFVPGDLSRTDFDVIAVGSFVHPRKGFRHLAEVYGRLGERGLRIADVGRRTDAQRDELAAVKNIRVFGTVDHPTLLSLMQSSAALLSTSLYEGFGLSLIESLACGRATFAFGAGAVPEVLSPIDPTLVVPVRDTEALVERVTDFLKLSPNERRQRGERYATAVRERYGLDRSAQALQALYRKLAESSQR